MVYGIEGLNKISPSRYWKFWLEDIFYSILIEGEGDLTLYWLILFIHSFSLSSTHTLHPLQSLFFPSLYHILFSHYSYLLVFEPVTFNSHHETNKSLSDRQIQRAIQFLFFQRCGLLRHRMDPAGSLRIRLAVCALARMTFCVVSRHNVCIYLLLHLFP